MAASGAIELKLEDYEALGGLRGALAAHGGEILDELLPEHREIAASVFRALAAGSSLAEAVRRPTEFGELVEIAGGDERGVREVVEAFRAPGRNFLMPPRPARLRPETVIDISHESLVRQWDQFAAWLQRRDRRRRGMAAAVRCRRAAQARRGEPTFRPRARQPRQLVGQRTADACLGEALWRRFRESRVVPGA